MKRLKKLLVLTLVVILAVVALVGCSKRQREDGYIVITFVTNCDDIVIDPIILDNKTEKFMPDDPVRAGYDFAGWFYDASFITPFHTEDALTMNTTLYARWVKKQAPGEPTTPSAPEDPKGLVYREETASDGTILYTVTGYNGTAEEVVIPSRYNLAPVTKIAESAFEGNSTVKKFRFGLNIEEVGKFAFRNCAALENIEVVEGNYRYASQNGILYNRQKTVIIAAPTKSSVDMLEIQKEVTDISDYAFSGCGMAVTFAYDSEISSLDGYDFAGFSGKLYLNRNITEIRTNAFKGADCEVIFDDATRLTTIYNGAFDSFAGKTLKIPNSVKKIYGHAFSGCAAELDLSKLSFGKIEDETFAGYAGEKLVIPYFIEEIGRNAFAGCSSDVSFEENSLYTEVGKMTFASFGAIVDGKYRGSVTFPSTLRQVGENAFWAAHAAVNFNCREGMMFFALNAFDNSDCTINYLIK